MPSGSSRATIVLLHGFLGWKEYGLMRALAQGLSGHDAVVHAVTFSHSGMDPEESGPDQRFSRPDLFREATWNTQVTDIACVLKAIAQGRLAGGDLPFMLLGHSRGGAAAFLAAGRASRDGRLGTSAWRQLAGVITLAAPAQCNRFSAEECARLRAEDELPVQSSRTGESLSISVRFLEEMEADPAGHDLPALIAAVACPLLVVHGDADPTVSVEDAGTIAEAAGEQATRAIIVGADHVFGVRHPWNPGDKLPPSFGEALAAMKHWIDVQMATSERPS